MHFCDYLCNQNLTAIMTDKAKGYVLGAIAAATYGMNPLFALPLYADGMNPDSVLLFRYLLALPVIAVMIAARGQKFAVQPRLLMPLAAVGVLMAASSLTLFLSYNYMDAGVASTLLFVYPVMVAVIMSAMFRERLRTMTIVCIATALAGIALLYNGPDGATLSPVGTMFVILSALSYAIYIVAVNRQPLNRLATLTLTFYVLLAGVLLFVVRLCTATPLTLPGRWYLWGNLAALGLFPTAISLICTTRAIQCIGSTPTAILGALEPVTAVIIGVTVFGERLGGREVAGLILIVGAVTLVVGGDSVAHGLLRYRKMFPQLRQSRLLSFLRHRGRE